MPMKISHKKKGEEENKAEIKREQMQSSTRNQHEMSSHEIKMRPFSRVVHFSPATFSCSGIGSAKAMSLVSIITEHTNQIKHRENGENKLKQ